MEEYSLGPEYSDVDVKNLFLRGKSTREGRTFSQFSV